MFEIVNIYVERWNKIRENWIDAVHVVRQEIEEVDERGWKL